MHENQKDFLVTKTSFLTHEMKNLLSICNLYTEIIEKQLEKISFDNEDTRKSFLNAISCISKSLTMSNNLLIDFRSMKENKIEKIELNRLIETSVEMSKIYAQEKEIKISNCNKLKLNILTDENKLLSVLINILKNAIESIDEKGEVLISTNEYDTNVKIRVSNTGKPISKKLQEQIFEEGFSTKQTGNGLGLAICKQTLKDMSGDLQLVKSDDKSTDFEITVQKK